MVVLTGRQLAAQTTTQLWDEAAFQLAIGERDAALQALAELTTHDSEAGPALQAAANIYVEAGDLEQAAELLDELRNIAGYGSVATDLLRLYWQLQRPELIVSLYETTSRDLWQPADLVLIRRAYTDALGEAPPQTGLRPAPSWHYSLVSSASGSRYRPFDDITRRDAEFVAGQRLQLRRRLDDDWQLQADLAWQHYWSDGQPVSFPAYRLDRLMVGLGTTWTPDSPWRLHGKIAPQTAENIEVDGDSDFGHPWQYALELSYHGERARIDVGARREVFVDADLDRLSFSTYNIYELAVELRLTPEISWQAVASRLEFSGTTSDYRRLESELTYAPGSLPSTVFSIGAGEQFRAIDETLVDAAIDTLLYQQGATQLYLNTHFEANLETHERELELYLSWSRNVGARRLTIGAGGRRELAVDNRVGAFLFVAVSGH